MMMTARQSYAAVVAGTREENLAPAAAPVVDKSTGTSTSKVYTFADMEKVFEPHYNLVGFTSEGRLIMRVDGVMGRLRFPNGYGISVIRFGTPGRPGSYSRGAMNDLYEAAVLEYKTNSAPDSKGELCYTTSITNDTLGYQSEADVAALMNQIAALC